MMDEHEHQNAAPNFALRLARAPRHVSNANAPSLRRTFLTFHSTRDESAKASHAALDYNTSQTIAYECALILH